MAKRIKFQTLEEVEKALEELDAKLGRVHGKKARVIEGETDEQRFKRLVNNYSSRVCRAGVKKLNEQKEVYSKRCLCLADDADQYGIRPVDERRYKGCFKSYYIGMSVERSYVKRMTGLSLKQIYELQKRTGLIPKPPVKLKEAKADEKRRWEEGIYS